MTLDTCKTCVLDSTSTHFKLSEDGECNYCKAFRIRAQNSIWRPLELRTRLFEAKVKEIKSDGENKKYDCIIGLSGGVDSTYIAYLVQKHNLRALAVHFDNGWNSELAVKNIENIISKTKFDLYTYVVNWEEFKDLQRAYLKAGVVDIEVLSDHMIVASLYKLANKHNVKYIIGGTNTATEGIMPHDWVYNKSDLTNILDIHSKFGLKKLKTYPKNGFYQRLYYKEIKSIEFVELLDLVDYNKSEVKTFIGDYFDWKDYGGKHYESIWTKFYQGYILPKKFNIDKRKAHLSNLILTGEIKKEEALEELKKSPIPIVEEKELIEYVCRKLDLSIDEFNRVISEKPVSHTYYKTEYDVKFYRWFLKVVNFFLWRVSKKLIKV
ncbi:MAG: N-acetyl sugar amidotransferase [Bacteroidetes bacterium]|nr:N-acetyl sugar amidotransferase [Bacteroidota bacterium]MCA6442024.1 N-acetyl sugar amidotransferase [Bacteroidota bacterium]